ncbi:hypothetical protein DD238_003024 [Peronospora effusa]|uniref:BZIP domain-containing protein n=1 Tax=Peronospora effusa TaxID=542832 RepID=A0A3M6VJJ7_9STRA|nr:hypothetical protein DD238_003035 [Peronospora effusa]RMX66506.1 hypothetical protein DD238_003024 [Peronospora effusa]
MIQRATTTRSTGVDEDCVTAILDNYEDATWDEICQLQDDGSSDSFTKKSPDILEHNVDPNDGNSFIQGRELSYFGEEMRALQRDPRVMSKPSVLKGSKVTQTVSTARPMTWVSVATEEILDCAQVPSTSAMQVRRQKNRDCMRRARQRKREEVDEMKNTLVELEKQYTALCVRVSKKNMTSSVTTSTSLPTNYCQAVALIKRLGAENLYLKAKIQHQATWKLHLYSILENCFETGGPRWAQQFQQPALGGKEADRMQFDRLDAYEAAQVFGFYKLTELDLTQVILDNNWTMGRVQNKLLIHNPDAEGRKTRRMQTFGWDIVQREDGSIMECVFTKKYTGLNVIELMQKTWVNDMRLDRFKKVKCETSRLEVLQQINPNAYVLGRDVTSPTDDISTFRSVFVRFLIETRKTIPASADLMATPTYIDAPSTTPMSSSLDSEVDDTMLEVTGYVLGTQSVDINGSHCEDEIDEKLAWAHLSLSIEFLNVVNPVTGEEYQQLRWTGRTNYCGEEHAHRNAGDTLQGMLRWELLTIAPALNLISLSQD